MSSIVSHSVVLLDTLLRVAVSNYSWSENVMQLKVLVYVPLSDPYPLSQPSQTLPRCIAPGSPHCGRLKSTESQWPQLAASISLHLPQSSVLLHQEMPPLLYQLSNNLKLQRLNLGPPSIFTGTSVMFCTMKMLSTLIATFSLPIQHTNSLCRWVTMSWVLGRSNNIDLGRIATKQFWNVALFATTSD